MIWRVEIKQKEGFWDALGESIRKDILDLGIKRCLGVRVTHVFTISGNITEEQIKKISQELLADRITQDFKFSNGRREQTAGDHWETVEIAYHPGVMDPVEFSTVKGIRDMGIQGVEYVRTSRAYHISGKLSKKELALIVDKVISNKLIQRIVKNGTLSYAPSKNKFSKDLWQINFVDILKVRDRELLELSQDGQLFLNLEEMRAIQKYFQNNGRNPTDCEVETIAQTWSEHCYHKTFRGNIELRTVEKGKAKVHRIRNLLKSTIVKATQTLDKPWCVSVFHDNAGIIAFDEDSHVCFKVETHNHPSALEPFGGANTGIGGVIRDILGTGLGAKPVCNTNVFCFASPDYPFEKLPAGILHPKRVMKGVVSGVRDYGNKMGIPTVNGAILFDDRFIGNPLVYCGNVGLIPKGKEIKKVSSGDLVVVVGGKTGRDGIHGATFSSGELTESSEVISSGAVQIGDPIQEKKVLDTLMQARDQGCYCAITDCGAGGLSSAVGEMGQFLGVKIQLDKVPLKYEGLSYTEIWISESQERMVLAVPPAQQEQLLKIFADENVEASVIGEFTRSGRLELFYHDAQVCDLEMAFLHNGIPKITKKASWSAPQLKAPRLARSGNMTQELLEVLGHYNVCSKEWVIRQYDHEVQGGSVIKPLVGINCDGPSDAAVVRPKLNSSKGLAISNGINTRFGMIDPFWMASSCIDEAIRQIIAVGGDMKQIALLDNFCWGNPDKPDRLGGLIRAAQGCYKTARGYGTPFISGKDSLYNEYTQGKNSIAIPGTLLISAIGIVDDVEACITMDFKRPGNLIYIVGRTYDELGGSIYLANHKQLGKHVPQVNVQKGLKIFKTLSGAVNKGLTASVHDCSEGGLGAALAEMAFSGGLGVTARLDLVPYQGKRKRDDTILFSESNTRFLVEVDPLDRKSFETSMSGVAFAAIGSTEKTPEFIIYGLNQKVCVNTYIHDLKEAWQRPLQWS